MKQDPRVALYIRVSKNAQRFESQEDELRAYCKARGWTNLQFYREKQSGVNVARTVLGKLMTDARHGDFDIIAVYKIDRLGRSLSHLLQIVQELNALGIGVISTSQGIDTRSGSASGTLMLNLLAAMAEFERELIQERTAAGLASARSRGVKLGRPGTSPEKIAAVLKLRKILVKGKPMPFSTIAEKTNLSIGMVFKIINKPAIHKRPP